MPEEHNPAWDVSGLGRIVTLVLTLPGLFLINRPLEIGAALLFGTVAWLLLGPKSGTKTLGQLRSLVWLLPGLVLANALFGPGPRLWSLFSYSGIVTGLIVAFRIAWAMFIATLLIRTSPPQKLLGALRAIIRFLHIPDRNLTTTVLLTLELVPQFASLRAKEFWNLPEAIARRIENVRLPASPPNDRLAVATAFRPIDLALILPGAGLVLISALL
ncbi:MAG: CbiQ family ECF transporter T component [candidate division WOR-3 bacterium]